jgi:DNA-binding beta-propeller fold protein YncE
MAQEVQIKGSRSTAKTRGALGILKAAAPGRAMRRLAAAAIFAVAMLGLSDRAAALLVWSEAGTPDLIARAHRDGTGRQELFILLPSREGQVKGVAIGGDYVYWTNPVAGTIGRANLDGSGVDPNFIVTNGGRPTALAVGPSGQHIYWSNRSGGTIGRADIDGSNVDQFFIFTATNRTNGGGPAGLAVGGGHIYWVNTRPGSVANSTIGRANHDGTGAYQNFITGLTDAVGGPNGLAIGPAGQHIYWANDYYSASTGKVSGSIGRANIDGSGVDQKLITLGAAYPLGVAVGQNHIFWADSFGRAIGRANKDGTGVDLTFIPTGGLPAFGVATIVGGYR